MDTNLVEKPILTLLLSRFKKAWVAIFYKHSVIFVYIEKQAQRLFLRRLREEIRKSKIPFSARKEYKERSKKEFADTYLYISKEEAICENSRNFEIRYSNIEHIKLLTRKTNDENSYLEGKDMGGIYIEAYSEKYQFNNKCKINDESVLQLKKLFDDKFVLLK